MNSNLKIIPILKMARPLFIHFQIGIMPIKKNKVIGSKRTDGSMFFIIGVRVFVVLLFTCCLACKNERENYTEDMKTKPESEMKFDQEKWKTKDGKDYPYREKMLNDVVYNNTIRTLNKNEILNLLGEPSYYRDNKNFLYYTITQKRLFSWPLHTRSMVIKLSEENSIEWIKIYE